MVIGRDKFNYLINILTLYEHLLAHEMRLEQHQTFADLALSSVNLASRTQENHGN
jgi:hypothetical protein